MRFNIALIILLGTCLSQVSARPFFSKCFKSKDKESKVQDVASERADDEVTTAYNTLISGRDKPLEQVNKELLALQAAGTKLNTSKYQKLVLNYLSMQNLSKDKCSYHAIAKIITPNEGFATEISLRNYRYHWGLEKFKMCKSEFNRKLHENIESLDAEEKRKIDVLLSSSKPFIEELSPKQLASGFHVNNQDVGSVVPKYVKAMVPEIFERSSKNIAAKEMNDYIHVVTRVVKGLIDKTRIGINPYFAIAPVPEALDLLDDDELEWLGKIRVLEALARTLGNDSGARNLAMYKAINVHRNMKAGKM